MNNKNPFKRIIPISITELYPARNYRYYIYNNGKKIKLTLYDVTISPKRQFTSLKLPEETLTLDGISRREVKEHAYQIYTDIENIPLTQKAFKIKVRIHRPYKTKGQHPLVGYSLPKIYRKKG